MGRTEIEAHLLSKAYLSRNKLIFLQYLPYWPDLEVPHAIDAMHMQKNVFESLIATLMDTGKSKDGLKSWKDMVQLNMMPQLHPVPEANGKYTLPVACFNLTLDEKRAICTFLREGQSPDWVFSKCEEASVDEGLVNNTLQGS